MCTAIKFKNRFVFRSFDYERRFGEELLVVPRESMRLSKAKNRYAIMGVGVTDCGEPLFFDGVNEWGLCAMALNFPKYCDYGAERSSAGRIEYDERDREMEHTEIPSAKLISYILGLCRSVNEAREMLEKVDITGKTTLGGADATPLHWMISDIRESIVVEPLAEGLSVRDNPSEILTNSPPLDYHLTHLEDFKALSAKNPDRSEHYSRGIGALGLPGDFSSQSRFVRAWFLKQNGDVSFDVKEGVRDIFRLTSSLVIPRGCVINDRGESVVTEYTAVIDMESPSYYLTTATDSTVDFYPLSEELINGERITVEKTLK